MADEFQFIKEQIKKPNRTGKAIRKILITAGLAALFGAVAALTMKAMGVGNKATSEVPETSAEKVVIPRDDPYVSVVPADSETAPDVNETVGESQVGEIVDKAMSNYEITLDNVNQIFERAAEVAQTAGKSLVTVQSITNGTDWFDNEVEKTGTFTGVIVAETDSQFKMITTYSAVNNKDQIRVILSDGQIIEAVAGARSESDGLAVITSRKSDLRENTEISRIELGSSYTVKQGDMVIAIGSPLGAAGSFSYGFISYINQEVSLTDANMRAFYADKEWSGENGTWVVNTKGQIIGIVNEDIETKGTGIIAISGYKGILERLLNNSAYPYLGIEGSTVNEEMIKSGMPQGMYVKSVKKNSPAYQAGIQPGDIIKSIGDISVINNSTLGQALEKLDADTDVTITVYRLGRDEYKELTFETHITSR